MHVYEILLSVIAGLTFSCLARQIPAVTDTNGGDYQNFELPGYPSGTSKSESQGIIVEDVENIVTIIKKNVVKNDDISTQPPSLHRNDFFEDDDEEDDDDAGGGGGGDGGGGGNEEDDEEYGDNDDESSISNKDGDLNSSQRNNVTDRAGRQRRSTRSEKRRAFLMAKVEVCIIVDYKLYNIFLEKNNYDVAVATTALEKYFAALIAMVNERYKEINEPRLSIKISLSDLWIAQSIMEASWVETHRNFLTNNVVGTHALESITKWLENQKVLRKKYDHVMVFTGHPMVNERSKTIRGIAYVGEICHKSRSASLIHDMGKYQSAGVAAHELGHSLGAFHDGVLNNTACPAEQNYIMSPTEYGSNDGKLNYMYLSECSIKQITNVLSKDSAECVFDKPNTYLEYNLQANPPGRRFTLDQQCSMVFGEKWRMCDQKSLLDNMCSTLWCQDSKEASTCRTVGGLRGIAGTRCGDGKMCWRGMCVAEFYKSTKSVCSTQKTCNGPDKNKKYCQKIVRLNPHACHRDAIASYCCESCSCQKTQNRTDRRRKRDKQRRRRRRRHIRRLRRKASRRRRRFATAL
ncbi:ADAM family mig-17 [Octopus vulgaris]|uniref:ADAM family mig-17 n=1 Tax=Octopus vulgaris TaxID=6645 RepID=A0AA36F6U0_OCTVU|nr:ADAM family mig-17 [Octopus vulgaris]